MLQAIVVLLGLMLSPCFYRSFFFPREIGESMAPTAPMLRDFTMTRRMTITMWIAAAGLVVALGGLIVFLTSGGSPEGRPEEKPAEKATYVQSFRGEPEDMQRYVFRSPVAGVVTFEADGLRIKLPAGAGPRPSTGLALLTTVQGDFDVSARFDILKEPEPEDTGPSATRVTLSVLLDTAERNEAAVSRRMIAKGVTQFFAFLFMDRGAPDTRPVLRTVPTAAKTGRLRLVRTGEKLSFYASEGDDLNYRLLEEEPFRSSDVKQIFLNGATGGPRAEIDVRLSDLRIVADSLPDMRPKAAPVVGTRRWSTAAVFVAVLLLMAALIGWFTNRRRGTREAATAVRLLSTK